MERVKIWVVEVRAQGVNKTKGGIKKMASIDKKVVGIISSIGGAIVVPLIVKNLPKAIKKLNFGKKQIKVNNESQLSEVSKEDELNETE